HRLDRERHAGHELDAGAGLAVMQDLRILVELPADAVAAVFADHREPVLLDEGLDRVPDVTDAGPRAHHVDAAPHRVVADPRQPLADHGRLADEEHPARVAVEAVLDDRDVDVQDVAVLQPPVTRDPVAHDVVHRCADRLREAAIVERRRHRTELVDDVLVADAVQLVGRNAGADMLADHVEHVGREAAGDTHLVLFLRRLDGDGHGVGVRRLRRRAAFVAPSVLWYKARAFQAINDTHAPFTRQPGASPGRARGRCGGAWRINPTTGASDGRHHDAAYAGSGRPFRTPDPLLEPEDGPLHLRRT